MEVGMKDGIFAILFIYLFHSERKNSKEREEKLYNFLTAMQEEFSKLVDNYESIAEDVSDIRQRLDQEK